MSRIKWVAILAILAIGTFILMSSIYTVSEVEQAIITQFGRPVGAPVTGPFRPAPATAGENLTAVGLVLK